MLPAMIASLRHFLGWLVSTFRSREDLVLENLALRRQLLALHAQQPRRRLTALHKLFWVALRTFWSGWTKPLILVTPRTGVNWHRAGSRRAEVATNCRNLRYREDLWAPTVVEEFPTKVIRRRPLKKRARRHRMKCGLASPFLRLTQSRLLSGRCRHESRSRARYISAHSGPRSIRG